MEYGGPNGELGASLRYLSQRYSMVTGEAIALLGDIGTEELAHMEVVAAVVRQLTSNCTKEELLEGGFAPYYVDHGLGIYPESAGGTPFSAAMIQSTGNPVADLYENMAAEQKAKATYEYLLDFIDDPAVMRPIAFLREREIVHFQRFGEALNHVKDYLESKRYY